MSFLISLWYSHKMERNMKCEICDVEIGPGWARLCSQRCRDRKRAGAIKKQRISNMKALLDLAGNKCCRCGFDKGLVFHPYPGNLLRRLDLVWAMDYLSGAELLCKNCAWDIRGL